MLWRHRRRDRRVPCGLRVHASRNALPERQPVRDYLLPIAYCFLLSAFCSLLTACYLLGAVTTYQVLRRLTAHYSLPTRCETASYVSLYDPTASASCAEFSPAAPHLAHQSLHHEVQRLTLQQARPNPNPNPCPTPDPHPDGSRCNMRASHHLTHPLPRSLHRTLERSHLLVHHLLTGYTYYGRRARPSWCST